MQSALLDTTVFIDYHKGDAGAIRIVDGIRRRALEASFSPITVVELWQGRLVDRTEEVKHEMLLSVMREVPLDTGVARLAALLLKPFSRKAKKQYFADALIAAAAKSRGDLLYSRDAHMPHLYHKSQSY